MFKILQVQALIVKHKSLNKILALVQSFPFQKQKNLPLKKLRKKSKGKFLAQDLIALASLRKNFEVESLLMVKEYL